MLFLWIVGLTGLHLAAWAVAWLVFVNRAGGTVALNALVIILLMSFALSVTLAVWAA